MHIDPATTIRLETFFARLVMIVMAAGIAFSCRVQPRSITTSEQGWNCFTPAISTCSALVRSMTTTRGS